MGAGRGGRTSRGGGSKNSYRFLSWIASSTSSLSTFGAPERDAWSARDCADCSTSAVYPVPSR